MRSAKSMPRSEGRRGPGRETWPLFPTRTGLDLLRRRGDGEPLDFFVIAPLLGIVADHLENEVKGLLPITLFVEIDLGFGTSTRQYLRLRGLDSPEIKENAGKRAKRFVEKLIISPFVFLTTTRSDKYDRYLADVFIPAKKFMAAWARGTAVLNKTEDLLYLNNELLKNKLAVRV